MKLLDLKQSSGEWLRHRAWPTMNASDAPAMMAAPGAYRSRADLVREKATGIEPEYDAATLARFRAGHEAEAAIRPHIETIIGEELYPVVGEQEFGELRLSASFDGLTMYGTTGFEHKIWNETLAASVLEGVVPESHIWQVVHQHAVGGLERTLFVVSDGTPEKCVWCWVTVTETEIARLLAGWRQFQGDVAAYQPEQAAQVHIGADPDTLPALFVQVEGRVVAGDVSKYRAQVDTWVASLPQQFETDQDFANGAKAVKACAEAEDNLKALAQQIRGQMADVDTVFRLLEESGAVIRDARLRIDAAVKANSKRIREQAVMNAGIAFRDHVASLTARIGDQMPFIPADFGAAIKGLKSVKSMNDAIGSALARAKIEANQIADTIQENSLMLHDGDLNWMFLFPDFRQVCTKAPEDFANLLMHRINEHKQREAAKLEAERERIRREESERITREAARADLQTKAQAAQEAREAEQRGKTTEATHAQSNATAAPQAPAASTPPIDDGKRLKLGELKAILAPISIDADGLAQLGIHPAGTEKAAKLYRAADVPEICRAIIGHLNAVISEQ